MSRENNIFNYQMLDRLRSDCDYYLGNGNGNSKHLYYKDINKQIEEMKKIYNSFSDEDKPKWISLDKIEDYRNKMQNFNKIRYDGEEDLIVAKFTDKENNLNATIIKAENGKFFNRYYDDVTEHYNSTAGPFSTEEKAREMISKHRSTLVEIKENELTNKKSEYDIYSGFKNEDSFRKNLISNIKKTNYENLKDKICSRLEYGFSSYDILRIAEAYKQNDTNLNKKIEYILTDCNFHSECSLLINGRADDLIESCKKEIENYLLNDLTKIYVDEYLANKETRGFIPINSVLVDEWSIEEHEFLVDKGILQKRDCEGYAYEFTDSYIEKIETKEKNNEEEEEV